MSSAIDLVECPRDAMQGWKSFIPTEVKVAYLNCLLDVGFDTLDCGSFVSAKAIPQMADTAIVIPQLKTSKTKLLVIVANERGAAEAVQHDNIDCLGYPFSVSPTFQMRNANSIIEASWQRVQQIQKLCVENKKELVVYISMGFGNPYGDVYNENIVAEWVAKLIGLGINVISLADTVGLATPGQVLGITKPLIEKFSQTQIGVHLHSSASNWKLKLDAAMEAGCKRYDGALKGIGGCPMANDELVGNMNTEWMIDYFQPMHLLKSIDEKALQRAITMAEEIFR